MVLLSTVYSTLGIGEGGDELRWDLSKSGPFQVKSFYLFFLGQTETKILLSSDRRGQ